MNADENVVHDFLKKNLSIFVFIRVHLRNPRSSASGFSTTEGLARSLRYSSAATAASGALSPEQRHVAGETEIHAGHGVVR